MAVRSVPKLGTELFEFMEPKFTVCDWSRTVWVANCVIYAMDCVVMCIGPEMAVKFGFTK